MPLDATVAITRAIGEIAQPCMVAIDGRSAAGKSTLADRVRASLNQKVALIRGDDFYRVMDEDQRFRLPPEEGYLQDFDWQRLRTEALEPLRRGEVATFRVFDWQTGDLGYERVEPPTPVILAEGVYMSRPELRDLFDLVVWVETPARLRNRRQAGRDDTTDWVHRWHRAEDHYVETVHPAESADILVSGAG